MTAAYQLTSGTSVLRTSDGASIPPDPANVDFRTYLVWLSNGNTPDPALIPPMPMVLDICSFYLRFTAAEQLAMQTVASGAPSVALSMTLWSAQGWIDLTSSAMQSWLSGLVPSGALSSHRMAQIIDPNTTAVTTLGSVTATGAGDVIATTATRVINAASATASGAPLIAAFPTAVGSAVAIASGASLTTTDSQLLDSVAGKGAAGVLPKPHHT